MAITFNNVTNDIAATSGNVTLNGSSPPSATITRSAKTGAYTVVAGDNGTLIDCTSGTFTVSLTAAATLGSGFNVTVVNSGTGEITIDPNATETLDGTSASFIIRRAAPSIRLVCDGANWQSIAAGSACGGFTTQARNVMLGSNVTGVGIGCVAIGTDSTANSTKSVAVGFGASATGNYQTAIGGNSATQASVAITGAGAMALGGSYASGTDSFAAAIGDNTSTYGAQGANSIAIGKNAKATAGYAVAFTGATVSGANGAMGFYYSTVSGSHSIGLINAVDRGLKSYLCNSGGSVFAVAGDGQWGIQLLNAATTDGTATRVTAGGAASSATNQLILANNQAITFTGEVISKKSGTTVVASWKVEGVIVRGANAASTVLVVSTVTAISNIPAWTLALTADTTNGGLAVTFTGAAATNIRTVATIRTTEVTYA